MFESFSLRLKHPNSLSLSLLFNAYALYTTLVTVWHAFPFWEIDASIYDISILKYTVQFRLISGMFSWADVAQWIKKTAFKVGIDSPPRLSSFKNSDDTSPSSTSGCPCLRIKNPQWKQLYVLTDHLNLTNFVYLRHSTHAVFFIHCATSAHENIPEIRRNCTVYFKILISYIDASISQNGNACQTVTNVVYKAYALNNSDSERELGCLRRKEKLSNNS